MDIAAEWLDRPRTEADGYARPALENITRCLAAYAALLFS